MERIRFYYTMNNDDGISEHSAELSFSDEGVGLDQIASKLKAFLNAAGYSVSRVDINETFSSEETDDE
jgi:hypothetical protein